MVQNFLVRRLAFEEHQQAPANMHNCYDQDIQDEQGISMVSS